MTTRANAPARSSKGNTRLTPTLAFNDGRCFTAARHAALHGTADPTVPLSQSETFLKIAKEKSAPCALEVIPDAPHTFDLQPKQRDLRPLVTAFFDQHLKAPAVPAPATK